MKAAIRELGTYTVAIDTIPPEIIPVNKNQWGRNGKIVYRLKDQGRELLPIVERLMESMLFGRPNIVKSYWECVRWTPKRVKKGRKAYCRIYSDRWLWE